MFDVFVSVRPIRFRQSFNLLETWPALERVAAEIRKTMIFRLPIPPPYTIGVSRRRTAAAIRLAVQTITDAGYIRPVATFDRAIKKSHKPVLGQHIR